MSQEASSNSCSGSRAIFVVVLTLLVIPSNIGGAPQFSKETTTVLSIPFSGALRTDMEDVSVSGVIQLQTHVTLTRTTLFARVVTSLSQTTGTGITSGQTFVAVGGPQQMCKVPAGTRGSGPVALEINPTYRLIPTGPSSPFYVRGAPERSLPLEAKVTFSSDGTLLSATVVVGENPAGSDVPATR